MQRVICRCCNSIYFQSWAKDASSSTLTSRTTGILHPQKQMGCSYLCKHPHWDMGAWAVIWSAYLSSASELGSHFVPLRISICRRQFTISPERWKCFCRALNKIIWPFNFLFCLFGGFFSPVLSCFSVTALFSSYYFLTGTYCPMVSLD